MLDLVLNVSLLTLFAQHLSYFLIVKLSVAFNVQKPVHKDRPQTSQIYLNAIDHVLIFLCLVHALSVLLCLFVFVFTFFFSFFIVWLKCVLISWHGFCMQYWITPSLSPLLLYCVLRSFFHVCILFYILVPDWCQPWCIPLWLTVLITPTN